MTNIILHTFYNYERVFRIVINKFNIKIYKHTWEALPKNQSDFVLELKSHICIYTGFQENDMDKFYIGNTILIKLTKNKYMFIGEMIYTLDIDEPIISYNSEVIRGQPFPYATTENYCYLFLDNVRIPLIYEGNPYEHYYNATQKGVEEFDYDLICDNYLI
jgi:hypothetical protein